MALAVAFRTSATPAAVSPADARDAVTTLSSIAQYRYALWSSKRGLREEVTVLGARAAASVAAATPAGGQSRSMSDVQPSGTVTLVFTDVEGSTDLLKSWARTPTARRSGSTGESYADAFGRSRGYEVDYEGDAFFYAFASAQAAVSAVSEAMVG